VSEPGCREVTFNNAWDIPLGVLWCARISLADLVDWEVSTM